jgi:hypothetical protein
VIEVPSRAPTVRVTPDGRRGPRGKLAATPAKERSMRGLKVAIAVVGILGVLACFLPFDPARSLSFVKYSTFFQVPIKAYVVIGGFGLAAIMGLLAWTRGGLSRTHAVLALVGSAVTLLPVEVRSGFDAGSIGGKLLFIAAVIGSLLALVGILRPENS